MRYPAARRHSRAARHDGGGAVTRPSYRDLPDGRAWDHYGRDDRLGSLNLLTAERVASAAALVESGNVYSLNAPLNWPSPNPFASATDRGGPRHHVIRGDTYRDDYLDGFYPQNGTQWDGFLHVLDPELRCFYNNDTTEMVGMDAWAERGIAGRGVLLDVASVAEQAGAPLNWKARTVVTVDDLEQAADQHGVEIEEGAILIVRVGWENGWNAASDAERDEVAYDEVNTLPGLDASVEMVEWLWDHSVAAVASDTPALEAFPPEERFLHVDLLARLGIPIGEMWHVDELAEACAAVGRYEFLLTSAPLNIAGGIGSTANVLAIM